MLGTAILVLVSALLLKLAVGLVGSGETENTFGTALFVSIVMALVGHFLGELDPGPAVRIAYSVSWLFVVKSIYRTSWLNALLVGIVLIVVLTGIKFAILATGVLSVAALGAFAILL